MTDGMSNGRYEQQMVRKIEMAGLCGVRWKDVDCCGQVVGSPALCSGNCRSTVLAEFNCGFPKSA